MEIETPDDGMKPMMIGHLLIRDKETGEVLVNQRDNLSEHTKEESNADDR